ncbi:WAT1-related protein [Sesamum angolense]|uniref:WAT1-related protein n=1 Tax=Sesamum angolense TaxID=2727404 RepID=A0AAE1WAD2_9LAMI|nr:WAT1-related protein [Sesamum angolense]
MGSEQNLCASMGVAFNKMKPYLAMISLQFGYAGMYIVTLLSFKHGFSHWIFVVYRHAIATLVFAPFAYFIEKKIRPHMTKSVFFKILVLAFLELEKVNLKKVHSVAKVIGTVITVAGAMTMTLYKGPAVNILWYTHRSSHQDAASSSAGQHWVAGTVMLLLSIVGWAAFFILQGIVCSGLAYYMQSVVNKVRGPVFVTAFSPLTMIITAVLGAIILSEQVHLGSLIGALIIVFGLYSVVWGKSKENSAANKLAYDEERAQELPATSKDIQGIVDADIIETTVKSKSHQKKNSPLEGP